MDDRLEAEEADIQAMFEHPGWIAIKRRTQEQLDAFRAGMPLNINDERQLYFMRGVIATLKTFLHMDAKPAQDETV